MFVIACETDSTKHCSGERLVERCCSVVSAGSTLSCACDSTPHSNNDCRMKYDVFGERSAVEPSALQPAKRLQWNISPDTASDIETASASMDK